MTRDFFRTMNPTVATSQTAATPLCRLALHSTSTCATQAAAYGQCILGVYQDVKKDVCKEEFAKFGQCLREAVRPPSQPFPSPWLTQKQMKRKW